VVAAPFRGSPQPCFPVRAPGTAPAFQPGSGCVLHVTRCGAACPLPVVVSTNGSAVFAGQLACSLGLGAGTRQGGRSQHCARGHSNHARCSTTVALPPCRHDGSEGVALASTDSWHACNNSCRLFQFVQTIQCVRSHRSREENAIMSLSVLTFFTAHRYRNRRFDASEWQNTVDWIRPITFSHR
jgi:hypothetical protein